MGNGDVMVKGIYSHVIVGAVCASLSFGVSQIWGIHDLKEKVLAPMQEEIRVENMQMKVLQKSDDEQRAMIATDRADFTTRMQLSVNLMTSILDNQKELIALIKVQNQIKQ